jgi:hypothetical protein
MAEFEVGCAYQTTYAYSNLDISEQIPSTNEPTIKFVRMERLIFKCYQVDSKEIKCPLQWWAKHEPCFLLLFFLVRQILGIVESQIEIERIFSLEGILTNLRRCHLQLNFFKGIDICEQKLIK